ncbi:MAG: hypothetical protein ABF992_11225 [Lentilactobacillus hilgardii]
MMYIGKFTAISLITSKLLFNNWKVKLQEIKAAVNDICTVATFEIKEPLQLVDLSQILNIGIFNSPEKDVYLMNQDILQNIDSAMRKSSTRNRSEVTYAPTEYMSDLIKLMGGRRNYV